jgi:hypothetical protein
MFVPPLCREGGLLDALTISLEVVCVCLLNLGQPLEGVTSTSVGAYGVRGLVQCSYAVEYEAVW